MLMNLKDKLEIVINEDMRYFYFDENYDEHAWDNLINALTNSEPYHVENSTNDDLIIYLKANIKEMNKADLQLLHDALSDEDNLFNEDEILAIIEDAKGD